jgi:hypothetical protein
MGLMDVVNQFENAVREAPPEDVSHGLHEAFRSDQTPPFEQMVGQLFGRSDPNQRAGFLNQILGRNVSPQQASQVPVSEVENATAQAAAANPSIMERASRFYAEHPGLVQSLGQVALTVAMNAMMNRRRSA